MNESEIKIDATPRRIFTASVIALLIATVLLFTVILPVEYQYDPLGTGSRLGLDALANAGQQPLLEQTEPFREDFVEFYLEPFQSIEYKYHMEADALMVFSWIADGGELYYDMHAEPAGLGPEFAESYGAGTLPSQSGTFQARFPGIHGWFWENRGRGPVELRLYGAGFFSGATIFSTSGELEREINSVLP